MLEDVLTLVGGILFAALLVRTISITAAYLDKDTARDKLKNRNIRKGFVKNIVKCDSITHIKLDAITEDDKEVEVDFETEGYDQSEIYEGAEIYV